MALTAAPPLMAQRAPDVPLDALHREKFVGTGKEIVFVDVAVQDYEALVSALPHGLEVVPLDPRRDGLEQITETLARRPFVDAVHLISHGSSGVLTLGGRSYSAADLERERGRLALWFSPVVNTGQRKPDLLIYGCNVGAGDNGREFLDTLSRLTGADIAASTNTTAAPQHGGDWLLEVATGPIEAKDVLIGGADGFSATLATFTVNSESDTSDSENGDGVCADSYGNCTLRAAIQEANATVGPDTVNFANGVQDVLLAYGEITIGDDLTLSGPGASNLTVDAQGSSRIFFIDDADSENAATVTIRGVTLANGDGGGGYGGAILSHENLVLRDSVVTGSEARAGGGVAVDTYFGQKPIDTVQIVNTTISDNGASYYNNYTSYGRGGGVSVYAPHAAITIANSTITGNTSEQDGGGVYIGGLFYAEFGGDAGSLTISNSSISGNRAYSAGGGIYVEGVFDEGSLDINHSRINDNTADRGGGVFVRYLDDSSRTRIGSTTISGNLAHYSGGGAYLGQAYGGASVLFDQVTLSGNTAAYGSGPLVLTAADRSPKAAPEPVGSGDGFGGGLAIRSAAGDADIRVTRSNITGNTSLYGGGIGVYAATGYAQVVFADDRISENAAREYGGGALFLSVGGNADVEIVASTVSGNNSAYGSGGGIGVYDVGAGGPGSQPVFAIRNSTLSGNRALQGGGGLWVERTTKYGSVIVENSTISGNTAGIGGGAYFGSLATKYPSSISHSTVAFNHAQYVGGVALYQGSLGLDHALIVGNTAEYGGGDLATASGSFLARFSLIGAPSESANLQDTEDNSLITNVGAQDVLDPQLRDNGGPTLTHDLVNGSPALDAGDPNYQGPPNVDQRGFTRVAGDAIDIGAVEANAGVSPVVPGDIGLEIMPPGQGGSLPMLSGLLLGLAGLWRRVRGKTTR
ncbi:MAG TPA: DUF4347 domain-containing protein [Candidatus Binatia bacterium]|nr:DUF4347 domain-containing protein [Candidatus Binatia bacterium]